MFYLYKPFLSMSSMILIISTLMAASSANWLFLWMAMELNLLSFIPMITNSHLSQETEAAIKYFLAQGLGSSILLMSSIIMWYKFSIPKNMYILLFSSILLKLGMAPFHFWFPPVMSSISWLSCLILSTWQKVAPLLLISFIMNASSLAFLSLVSMANALMGGLMGMNQSNLRSIMAYSSITHMGWMTSMLTVMKPVFTITYFIMYSLIITPLFMILKSFNSTNNNQLTLINKHSPIIQLLIPIMLLSLSGIPPLTGFIPKWLTISTLVHANPTLLIILIMGAMMNLYFYLNILFNAMLNTSSSFNNITMNTLKLTPFISISSLILIFLPLTMIYAMNFLYKS